MTGLHCFLFVFQFICCFCLSVSSSLRGWTARATHLTSGQLSKQDTPFTLTPRGREAIDNSLSAVSQFVHFWNWPWTLLTHRPLTGEEGISDAEDGGGRGCGGRSFIWDENLLEQLPYMCFQFQCYSCRIQIDFFFVRNVIHLKYKVCLQNYLSIYLNLHSQSDCIFAAKQ